MEALGAVPKWAREPPRPWLRIPIVRGSRTAAELTRTEEATMVKVKQIRWSIAAVLAAAALATSGCRVENNKNGDHKDVKIATPFGGMQVKTNDANVAGELGL